MFFFLSKFLPLFVYPVGFVVLLLGLALLLQRWRGWQTAVLLIALLLLYLASNSWVAWQLARSLEWRYLPPPSLPHVDVIVVLGGGTRWADPPQPVPNLNEGGDRLLYAASLYQQGVADHLLLTGGALPGATRPEAEEMADALQIMGVPEEALMLETRSLNTYENAVYTGEMLAEAGITQVVLLTSAVHMPRAAAVFSKQGIDIIPAPTDYFAVVPDWDEASRPTLSFQLLDWLPSADALWLTTRVLKEYLGLLIYNWRGWV